MGEEARGKSAASEDAAARRLTAWIARGDQAALDEFYRAWFNWSYLLARTLTRRDESFCLDVVQEAMLRVTRSIKAMDSHGDLERWMTRVVHTTALDLLRRESRRAARERARELPGTFIEAPSRAEATERIAWVQAQLADLPAEEGWMVWLRFGKDRTLAHAGIAAGVGAQAAHGRIRRALRRLRGKENGDERA